MEHGSEVWRASPDRHWTGRESEERAARENDWPKEAEANPNKDSSTLNKKTDDKNKTSNLIKDTNILKAREGGK